MTSRTIIIPSILWLLWNNSTSATASTTIHHMVTKIPTIRGIVNRHDDLFTNNDVNDQNRDFKINNSTNSSPILDAVVRIDQGEEEEIGISLSSNRSKMATITERRTMEGSQVRIPERRAIDKKYYYTAKSDTIGGIVYGVTKGNPLKGITGTYWLPEDEYTQKRLDYSLEFSYVPFNEVMLGWNQFDWTALEKALNETSSRNRHLIPRFFMHYMPYYPSVPQFLLDIPIEMRDHNDLGGGVSPYYGDPNLLLAIKQFIQAFGERYDGDKRIGYIQAGLLGYWGEWHTLQSPFIPDDVKDQVIRWYDEAFAITPIQLRYSHELSKPAKMGYHDDSFAFSTLDGEYNAGVYKDGFFWPQIVADNNTDFWRTGPMGGEMREGVDVFSDTYVGGAKEFAQDFMTCVYVTHTTHMKIAATVQTESEHSKAIDAHQRMGYNIYVNEVSVYPSLSNAAQYVDIDALVENIGIAPFYYPLSMKLECATLNNSIFVHGLEKLIDKNDKQTFTFVNVPAKTECLNTIVISLYSDYVNNENRPVKFAQKDGKVRLSIPLPPQIPSPVSSTPVSSPPIVIIPIPSPTSSKPISFPPIKIIPAPSPVSSKPISFPPILLVVKIPSPVSSKTKSSPIVIRKPPTPAPAPTIMPTPTMVPTPTLSPFLIMPTPLPDSSYDTPTSAPFPNSPVTRTPTSLFENVVLVDCTTNKAIRLLRDGRIYDLNKIGKSLTVLVKYANTDKYYGVFSWTEQDSTPRDKIGYARPLSMGGKLNSTLNPVPYLTTVGAKMIRIALKDRVTKAFVEIRTISFTLIQSPTGVIQNATLVNVYTDTDIDTMNQKIVPTFNRSAVSNGFGLALRANIDETLIYDDQIEYVNFYWTNPDTGIMESQTEENAPYVLGMYVFMDYLSSNYLSTPGMKTISIIAYEVNDVIIGEHNVSFVLV